MSRQQSFAPDEPELRQAKAVKAKPWNLWHKWRKSWWRHGRYRTRQEAEKAMADQVRKHHEHPGDVWWRGRWLHPRLGREWWAPDRFRVMHEDEGKPE